MSTDAGFPAPRALPAITTRPGYQLEPFLSWDGTELFYAGSTSNGGDEHIWRAPVTNGAPGAGAMIDELAGAGDDNDPVLSHDGRTIYFSRDFPARTGQPRVFRATRAQRGGTFTNVKKVMELDGMPTTPGWISEDNCRLYLNRGSADAGSRLNAYVATRSK